MNKIITPVTYELNVLLLIQALIFVFFFLHGSLHNNWNKLEWSKYKTNFQQYYCAERVWHLNNKRLRSVTNRIIFEKQERI